MTLVQTKRNDVPSSFRTITLQARCSNCGHYRNPIPTTGGREYCATHHFEFIRDGVCYDPQRSICASYKDEKQT